MTHNHSYVILALLTITDIPLPHNVPFIPWFALYFYSRFQSLIFTTGNAAFTQLSCSIKSVSCRRSSWQSCLATNQSNAMIAFSSFKDCQNEQQICLFRRWRQQQQQKIANGTDKKCLPFCCHISKRLNEIRSHATSIFYWKWR